MIYDHIYVAEESILLEEKEHLNETIEELHKLSSGFVHAKQICALKELSARNGSSKTIRE